MKTKLITPMGEGYLKLVNALSSLNVTYGNPILIAQVEEYQVYATYDRGVTLDDYDRFVLIKDGQSVDALLAPYLVEEIYTILKGHWRRFIAPRHAGKKTITVKEATVHIYGPTTTYFKLKTQDIVDVDIPLFAYRIDTTEASVEGLYMEELKGPIYNRYKDSRTPADKLMSAVHHALSTE